MKQYEIYEENNEIKVKVTVRTHKGQMTYFVMDVDNFNTFVEELRDVKHDIMMMRIKKAMSMMVEKTYEPKPSKTY